MNFQQTYLYWLAGAVLLVVAIMSLRDKSNPRRLDNRSVLGPVRAGVLARRLDISTGGR